MSLGAVMILATCVRTASACGEKALASVLQKLIVAFSPLISTGTCKLDFAPRFFQWSRPAIMRCRTSQRSPSNPNAIRFPIRRESYSNKFSNALAGLEAREQPLCETGRNGNLIDSEIRPWDDHALAQVAITERPPLATLGESRGSRAEPICQPPVRA